MVLKRRYELSLWPHDNAREISCRGGLTVLGLWRTMLGFHVFPLETIAGVNLGRFFVANAAGPRALCII
jgi:hypothetical protein